MSGLLKKRVAFITGAGSGIGQAIATEFAKEGATVIIAERNMTNAKTTVQAISQQGGTAHSYEVDVTDESGLTAAIDQTVKAFGRLDILVNNAGFQHVSPIETFPTDTFEALIKVMLTAPFMAIKHTLPIMKQQQYGRIINLASINGLIGFAGKAGYNSAKHGVIGLTKVCALESAPHNITVNALCPGYVDTPLVQKQLGDLAASRNVPLESVLEEVIYPLVPQKKLIDVQEIADYAVYLASDKARSITGQAVIIDGGYTAQ
ncbi:3-hydroxybutyrate dehydrogenase [Pullulanibacillus sp. KACC 23026]|uniref:3-hydroxybutyrate dehydrogenase n=1 Tax=Pullulanibacillus sp. KACC 23026 TaxID=3028315 RepID=UPI0023B09105|nr:3-hydroxybutyrate dehydrogenase [Pullulanibacillus sp. KACC 23026]WEG12312.1 3-hydroxybutyrate dehydrogenase [Pullulanibacillus sp. KACC 23026]